MQEFVKKLIERLEEAKNTAYNTYMNYEMNVDLGRAHGIVKAIEIVNQLAEEYNNDFCEWKKTDKSKYSPYHHALKHGNITLEFHDDFKFCPYCGKKIKVVE